MEEFLVPIIDVCRKMPGFENLHKQDAHKWKRANDIRRHYQTTPHKMEVAWKVTSKCWEEDMTGHLCKLGGGYIYMSSCHKFSRSTKWEDARNVIQ